MTGNRRRFLQSTIGSAALALAERRAAHAQAPPAPRQPPITMVINQSPWFAGFRGLVEAYQSETGNQIVFEVNPYALALEKVRNSLRAASGQFDLLAIDNNWMVEIFAGGFLQPVDELEPGFRLDPAVNTFSDTIFWNAERRTFDARGGRMMGVPINGNVEMLFYRADLYQEKGLAVPRTLDELMANVVALNDPPRTYGLVHRDDRTSTTADFANYLFSSSGSFFADPAAGDYTVTINSPAALRAFEFYRELGRRGGHPSPGSVSQALLIQLLLTGRTAHAIAIAGAWAQVDDPRSSAVVGKINATLMPRASTGQHASRAGHWIGAIARNVPRARQLAALEFLKWTLGFERQVLFTRGGGIPVRTDMARADLSALPQARFLPALAENSRVARMVYTVPEAAQLFAITDLRLNEAIIGQLTSIQALNRAAAEMHEVMQRAGYRTGRLPDLT